MRASTALVLACAVAVGACTAEEPGDSQSPEPASPAAPPAPAAIETVISGTLTACVAPTPALVEPLGGSWQGFDVGVLDAVADELALEVAFEQTTYDELVSGVALNSGRCDVGAAGVVDHDALDSVVRTSDGYRTVHRLVVTTTAGSEVEPAEVTGTVGVLEGSPAEAEAEALEGAEVVPYPSSADLRRALEEGAVDAALVTVMQRAGLEADLGTSLHLRSRIETDEETVLLLPLGADDHAVEAIDGALAAAREDGRLAALAEDWLAG